MHKLKILLISLLLMSFIQKGNTQEYRTIDTARFVCDYDYFLQQDSTDISSANLLNMRLLTGEEKSLFQPLSDFYKDSLILKGANFSEIWTFIQQQGGKKNILSSFHLLKNVPREKIKRSLFYINRTYFYTEDKRSIEWRLSNTPDTLIMGYPCKKATTHFAGRDYEAWYTLEIPISDGPYKFDGLPGLIVKIEDSKGEHRFELVRVYKPKNITPIVYSINNRIQVEPKELLKILSNFAIKGVKNYKLKGLSKEDKIRMNKKMRSRNNFIEKLKE